MIGRDPETAARERFDLLVVGGGVYGIALTLEAARRGLRALLLERGDFGGETSWNSLRIVHGGLRYLQSLDLPRFGESVAERRWWLRHFPDQVHPLGCLMPLYGEGLKRPIVFSAALGVNDLLSWRRNLGVRADHALPAGRVLSADEALDLCPLLEREGLQGAALWHDGVMPDSQRLLIEMLHWAAACGAVALNYVEARRLLVADGAAEGVEGLDLESGRAHRFQARAVVNCAGPWCREVADAFDRDLPALFRFSLAFNLLLDREPWGEQAVAVAPRSAPERTLFLVPWKGRILAGTGHAPWQGPRAEAHIDRRLIRRFLADLREALPELDLHQQDVLRVHWGFLPAKRSGTARLAVREVIHHHGDQGGPKGLFSVSGVKFTTAREVAEKTLRRVCARRRTALPGVAGAERPAPMAPPPREEIERLLETDRRAVVEHVARLIREESALRPGDLLLRRTDWGSNPRRGLVLVHELGRLLGWDEHRMEREAAALAVPASGRGADAAPGER